MHYIAKACCSTLAPARCSRGGCHPSRGEFAAPAVTLGQSIGAEPDSDRGCFTTSDHGLLAYHSGLDESQLTWIDRASNRMGTVGAPELFAALKSRRMESGRLAFSLMGRVERAYGFTSSGVRYGRGSAPVLSSRALPDRPMQAGSLLG